MKQVTIEDGRHAHGLYKHINLKSDGETFILSWEDPITDAWLVMVDECILRIDYKYKGYQYSECCFTNGYNYKPFLKCSAWDEKTCAATKKSRTYNFKNTDKEPPIGIKPLWLHNEHRLSELNRAIMRYSNANMDIPEEWMNEKQNLESYLKNRNLLP